MLTFSVIVPVYKVEPYIDECITSILNQTFTDFELILIDDGSPDKCPQICDSYADKDARVKVIHKSNGGVTSARNAGIQISTGDYLVFVDGDDFIGETLLEKLFATLLEHPVDVVAFGYTDYRDGRFGDKHYNELPVGEYSRDRLCNVYEKILIGNSAKAVTDGAVYHFLWAKTVKRDLFWNLQKLVPKEIVKGEDAAAVMLTVCNCNNLYVSDIYEYNYRYVASSVTHRFNEQMLENNRLLIDLLSKNCPQIPGSNITAYAMLSINYEIINAAMYYKTYNEFYDYIKKHFERKFEDILAAPLKINLPASARIKFNVIKNNWLWVYWIYYHYLKKNDLS